MYPISLYFFMSTSSLNLKSMNYLNILYMHCELGTAPQTPKTLWIVLSFLRLSSDHFSSSSKFEFFWTYPQTWKQTKPFKLCTWRTPGNSQQANNPGSRKVHDGGVWFETTSRVDPCKWGQGCRCWCEGGLNQLTCKRDVILWVQIVMLCLIWRYMTMSCKTILEYLEYRMG